MRLQALRRLRLGWLLGLAAAGALPASAEDSAASALPEAGSAADERIQVTATRLPEDVLDVPSSLTIVDGGELEARGVRTLAGALAFVGGVSIAPGGDGGPAGSVPEMMGLREFDAFLLVVDGVPWGGTFNPALATLDLTNVDRIEVLRGAAPVLYGATSFVGVIHVIHRTPEATPREVDVWGGTYRSYSGAVTSRLPGSERFVSSLAASFEDVGYRDDRTGFRRAHALWSAGVDVGGGDLILRVDLTAVDQEPASPHPREGSTLSPRVPIDANFNPADAAIDEERYHFVVGYGHPAGAGDWTTTLAFTRSERDTVRGFLDEDFDPPPGQTNATGYSQELSGDDLYLDTHWSWRKGPDLSLVTGADVLAGRGEVAGRIFDYMIPFDGTGVPPGSGDLPVVESPEFEDERVFGGLYALALWSPSPRWRIDAGLRLNLTRETQEGEVDEGGMDVRSSDEDSRTRASGNLGVSFRPWVSTRGALWLFAGYTNAFKPAAVDFGPEAEGMVLEPETAETLYGGLKGSHVEGRVFWQIWAYRMDFQNLVVSQTVSGLPSLTNAGTQRFEGVEAEVHWRCGDSMDLRASYAAHSAKFQDYVAEFDGVPTQLAGNSLEMSPDRLASLGVTWYPRDRGFLAWGGLNYVGRRYLNKRNTAVAGAYTAFEAGIGYRFRRAEVRLDGANLSDVRDPISESELGESQYYLLPARRYRLSFIWRFGGR
ncbi:MAG: TonB-dependent receptor [Acidobacteriota bacterium]|jgi:iron complex outermembrane receptor protein